MLLGTFQPEIMKMESKYIDILKDYLGFSPIFCFSCETEEEAIINSLMTTGSYPENFYVIDTSDFVKMDTVRWHYLLCKYGADNNFKHEEIKNCFEIKDDAHICYLISFEAFQKNIKIKFKLLDLFDDISFFNNKLNCNSLCLQDKYDLLQELSLRFETVSKTKSKTYAFQLLKNDFTVCAMSKILSNLYEVTYNFNYSKYLFLFLDYQRCLFTANIFDIKYKTNDYFDKILQKYKSCFNDITEYSNTKIYPNDKCPCGSGLKYKKCCDQFKIKREHL